MLRAIALARRAGASPRRPSGLPWRPRCGRSRSRASIPSRTASADSLPSCSRIAAAASASAPSATASRELADGAAQLLREVFVEVQTLQRALLRRLHRERRVRDDAPRVVARGFEQVVARHDRVQQPHLERTLGRNEVGAQQELHRLRPRDLPGQAHGGSAAGEQAALGLHDRELRFGARDADVATAQHLHAARGAEAVHRGDHRLVQRPVPQHGPGAVVEAVAVDLGEALLRDLGLELRDLGDVLLQVGAGEERFARHP